MTEPNNQPFWIDWEYDGEYASDRRSRYLAYLRDRRGSFEEISRFHDDPKSISVAFAIRAWEIATGPIMAPGLVRSHGRVLGTDVYHNEWNGEIIADVRFGVPRPAILDSVRPSTGGYFYDNWSDAWGSEVGRGVSGQDLASGRAYMATTSQVLWQIPPGRIPGITAVPTDDALIFDLAKRCVRVLVDELNREAGPVLAKLERG